MREGPYRFVLAFGATVLGTVYGIVMTTVGFETLVSGLALGAIGVVTLGLLAVWGTNSRHTVTGGP